MKTLNHELASSYIMLHYPDLSPAEAGKKCREFLETIERGERSFADYFVMLGADRQVIWSLSLIPVQEAEYIAIPPRQLQNRPLDLDQFTSIITSVIRRCAELNANRVDVRLVQGDQDVEISKIFTSNGFSKKHERIEFKTQIANLPDEEGTPLTWESASASGAIDLESAAELLGQAGRGDPDWSTNDDPCELLTQWLADAELSHGPKSVQIGFSDGNPAAIVIAQVNQRSGWSRITYMGLLPEFRQRGLGKWIHRHGFTMMKEQGGKEYHGGTVSTNTTMIRLFHRHNCIEFRKMDEWTLSLVQAVLDISSRESY